MADDERRRAHLAGEAADERVDLRRVRGVELAGRLVGDEEPRPVRERRTDRDALLLAAGELRGQRIAPVEEADALEQVVGDALPLHALDTEQRKPERDELPRGQLRREGAGIVLIGVAERARPVLDEPPAAQGAQVVAEDADRARRWPVEPGEDPQERALAGAARPEDDEQLAERDVERQALQRDRRSFR